MEDNIVDGNLPKQVDALFEKVKNTFFSEYFPIQNYKPGVIFMSTRDIYNLFYNLYPDPFAYTESTIAECLHLQGFKFIQMKQLQYEWMLYPADI